MRILVSTQYLAPYRADWLDELGKDAEITVFSLLEGVPEREKKWLSKRPHNCAYKSMRGITVPKMGKISLDFIKELRKNPDKYDIVILDGYGYAAQLLNIWFLNKKKIKFFVNVDGIVPKENAGKWEKCFKKRIFSKIPYFLCGSYATNDILYEYGVGKDRIINHPVTTLFERDIFKAPAKEDEKKKLRAELGQAERKIIVSVGRFTYLGGYGKGYDVLLKAAKEMSGDFGWYIVGGEPTEEFVKMAEGLNNVHFIRYVDKEKLKDYYRAADVFALMTVSDVWGFVINESMACGLPVVTTDKCMAGLDLVKDGENGYLVKVGDTDGLRESIEKIIDGNADGTMGENAIKTIQPYTIENMAKIHMEAFNKMT